MRFKWSIAAIVALGVQAQGLRIPDFEVPPVVFDSVAEMAQAHHQFVIADIFCEFLPAKHALQFECLPAVFLAVEGRV